MTTVEGISIAGALLNAVFVPLGVWALGALIDKRADARIATVRQELHDHGVHDDERFDQLGISLRETESRRETQHVENQKILTRLDTNFDWLKKAILRTP